MHATANSLPGEPLPAPGLVPVMAACRPRTASRSIRRSRSLLVCRGVGRTRLTAVEGIGAAERTDPQPTGPTTERFARLASVETILKRARGGDHRRRSAADRDVARAMRQSPPQVPHLYVSCDPRRWREMPASVDGGYQLESLRRSTCSPTRARRSWVYSSAEADREVPAAFGGGGPSGRPNTRD